MNSINFLGLVYVECIKTFFSTSFALFSALTSSNSLQKKKTPNHQTAKDYSARFYPRVFIRTETEIKQSINFILEIRRLK